MGNVMEYPAYPVGAHGDRAICFVFWNSLWEYSLEIVTKFPQARFKRISALFIK